MKKNGVGKSEKERGGGKGRGECRECRGEGKKGGGKEERAKEGRGREHKRKSKSNFMKKGEEK